MLMRRKGIIKFKIYLEQTKQNKTTAAAYISCLSSLFKSLTHPLAYTKEEELLNFFESKKYSINTRNLYIAAIKAYCKYYKINSPLLEMVSTKPDVRVKANLLNKEEVEDVLLRLPYKQRILLSLMLETGIRKAEAVSLRKENINLNEREIKIFGKRRKERIVYITHKLAQDLKEYFHKEPQLDCTAGRIRGLATKVSQLSGKKITPHVWRHLFATHFYQRNKDLYTLGEILGHENINTTRIYVSNGQATKEIYTKTMEG